MVQLVKNSPAVRETLCWIPGLGISPGKGKGYPLQYSGLENSMDCLVHEITKNRTQLGHFRFHIYVLCIIYKYTHTSFLRYEINCY